MQRTTRKQLMQLLTDPNQWVLVCAENGVFISRSLHITFKVEKIENGKKKTIYMGGEIREAANVYLNNI